MHLSDDARIQISRRMKQKSEKTLYIARNLNHAPFAKLSSRFNDFVIISRKYSRPGETFYAKNDKRSEASKNSTIV